MRPPSLTADSPSGWAEYYMGTLGWSLTPIPRGRKGPLGEAWNKPRSVECPEGYLCDPSLAASVWKAGGNMGVVLGPSGLVSLDADHLEGTRLAMATAGIELESLLTSTIRIEGRPGRARVVFRAPSNVSFSFLKLTWPRRTAAEKPITVFELRAGARQDVLPPSIHPDTKKQYRWILAPWEIPEIPVVPPALLDLWTRWDTILPTMMATCPWSEQVDDSLPPEPVWRAARSFRPDRDFVRDEIRRRYPLAGLLEQLGSSHVRGRSYRCPFHGPDQTPSFWTFTTSDGVEIWVDGHGDAPVGRRSLNGYFVGDCIDLYQHLHGMTMPEAVKAMSAELGLAPPVAPIALRASRPPGGQQTATQTPEGGGIAPEMQSDYGNAERLVARHGQDLKYCHPMKQWFVWDGCRWGGDNTGEVMRRAKDSARTMFWDADALEPDAAAKLRKFSLKSEQEKALRACIALAESEPSIPVLPAQLDADPFLFNVENGTIDLRRAKQADALRPHAREALITRMAPVRFDLTATCPQFLMFLDYIFAGDRELIAYIQRLFGYCLSGDVSEQALFIACGSGRNGKSTLFNLMNTLTGDYSMQASSDLLLKRRSDSHPTGIADLRGQRLVLAIETESGGQLAEALVKQLTGGDSIRARHLYRDNIEFKPTHKLILATNHRPVVEGNDFAIWRRIHLIPFNVRVSDDDVDRELAQKLLAEAPGILNWALEGVVEWRDLGGLAPPSAVLDATADYQREMDILGDFLEERCDLGPEFRAPSRGLYAAYQQWCATTRVDPISMTAFGSRLTERGIPVAKTNGTNWRKGIRLRAALVAEGDAA